MSIKSLGGSNLKNSSSKSESFDLNFKQIEQTNQILNNIEGKLNSFFKKKKKTDNSFEKTTPIQSQKHSPVKNFENTESSFFKNTQNKKVLFSNTLINESLNQKFLENNDLQATEQKLQEDLGSLKQRLNSIQPKIPSSSCERFNLDGTDLLKERSLKLQSFKEQNENISSDYHHEKMKLLEEKFEIMNKEMNHLKEDKINLIDENEKLKEKLTLINRTHTEDLRRVHNQNSELLNDLESTKSEKNILQMRLAEKESNYNILQDELYNLEKKYQNIVTSNNNEQLKAEISVKSMQEEIKMLESKYQSALCISNNEQKQTNETTNINGDLFKMLGSYQEELERIKTMNQGISEHFKSEVGKLQTDLKTQKLENEAIKEELFNLKSIKICDTNPKISNYNDYTRNLEKSFIDLETQHKQQIEKNNDLKQLLNKLTSKNKEDFKNFNDLYHEIYGKKSDNLAKNEDKSENSVFLDLKANKNEKKTLRCPSRGRNNSKNNGKVNKSISKTKLIKSKSSSSDKENKLDKCHQEIKRLKDLVNEKITLKKKEKPKKMKKKY